MGNLDDIFNSALSNMSGIKYEEVKSITGLTVNSSNIEILDYIMVQLCQCLDTKQMAFKGGYVLNKILPIDEIKRETNDIDFSISIAEYYCKIKVVLNSIGKSLVNDRIIDSYEIKDTITDTSSGGIKLHRNNKNFKDLGVDIGLHNIKYGVVPMSVFGLDVTRFSIERMLSDKISAIYSRKRFRRPKDLYDFYVITNCFNVNMHDLLEQVNIRNTIDWNASPMNIEVAKQYKLAYDKLIINKSGNSLSSVNKPDFADALGRVSMFVQNWNSELTWNCNERRFKSC